MRHGRAARKHLGLRLAGEIAARLRAKIAGLQGKVANLCADLQRSGPAAEPLRPRKSAMDIGGATGGKWRRCKSFYSIEIQKL
jgi:hypothetical protein